MHLVFLSRPDRGHLYPTLALAEELGARGHHVTFATGDPYADEAAGPGVTVVRFGRHERVLRTMPAVTSAGPPAAVVGDPRTADAGFELAREWGVPLLVAGTNLPPSPVGWPAEHSYGDYGDYVFTIPGARGTVHDPWRPASRRPVLLAALGTLDGPSMGLLARAFGATAWQVVIGESAAARRTALPHATVLLTDGRLDGVSAAVRAGVPTVVAPRTTEQRATARQVVALGTGIAVSLDTIGADQLCKTVEQLAEDEPTRAVVRRFRLLAAELGAATRAADEVEALLSAGIARAA